MSLVTANFTSSVLIGNAPLEVSFINTSQGPFVRVQWDFGDGEKSDQINPVHVYNTDGSYIVKLTVYKADGTSSVASQTITVLSQQFGSVENTQVQQALFTYKRFDPGQVSVRRTTTTGSTFDANAVVTSTGELQSTGQFVGYAYASSFTGGSTMRYAAIGNLNDFLGRASDVVVAVVLSPTGTTSGDTVEWNDVFTGGPNSASLSTPVLFYRIASVDTGNTIVTLDRDLLTTTDDGTGRFAAYFFGVCGATASFGSSVDTEVSVGIDIGVDSAEQVVFPGIDFATYTAARKVRGFASYVGYTGASGATYAVLYPEHSGAGTVNRFYPGNTYINIPWVLWHENTAPGLELFDSADPTQRDVETSLRTRWLRAGRTTNDTIVGQVFYDKQMVLITDPELVAALMYNNDRSWTLPAPTVKHVASSSGWVSGGTAPTGVSWYFTYRVVERDPASGAWPTANLGSDYLGYSEEAAGLPCQYIQRIDVPSGAPGVGYFNITIPKLNQATGGTACVANDINGFVASWVEIVAATGATSAAGPDMSSWRVMTGAPAEAAWTGSFSSPSVITIDETSSFRYDLSGETYTWASTNLEGSATLAMGDEPVLFANFTGNFASDIYKMSAVCVARNNEFNNTQNMTFDEASNDFVYVTEVGLYNETNDLLMVGKLSRPVKKNDQKFLTIKLELDL